MARVHQEVVRDGRQSGQWSRVTVTDLSWYWNACKTETQYLCSYAAIQFADFLPAGSGILTSPLFSLAWPTSLHTQGYFLTFVLQSAGPSLSLQPCTAVHLVSPINRVLCSQDQDINMLPTQSYSIPRLTKSLDPMPKDASSQNVHTTLITRRD